MKISHDFRGVYTLGWPEFEWWNNGSESDHSDNDIGHTSDDLIERVFHKYFKIIWLIYVLIYTWPELNLTFFEKY